MAQGHPVFLRAWRAVCLRYDVAPLQSVDILSGYKVTILFRMFQIFALIWMFSK